jgi:hypothetical protein
MSELTPDQAAMLYGNSKEQVDRLAGDLEQACETLAKKGAVHPRERHKMKRTPGY